MEHAEPLVVLCIPQVHAACLDKLKGALEGDAVRGEEGIGRLGNQADRVRTSGVHLSRHQHVALNRMKRVDRSAPAHPELGADRYLEDQRAKVGPAASRLAPSVVPPAV